MRFSVVTPPARDTFAALRLQTYPNFEVVGDPDAAAGDVVAFLAAGAVPEPRWLEDLAAAYTDPAVGGAGGWVLDPAGERPPHRYAVRDRGSDARRDVAPPLTPYQLPGADPYLDLHPANASFRRPALAAVGGFGPDVCRRMIDAGYRLIALDGAVVYAGRDEGRGMRDEPIRADSSLIPHPSSLLCVCFVSREYPPGRIGGIGRHTHELARGMAAEGHEVHVVTEGVGRPTVRLEDGVWVRRVPTHADGPWGRDDLWPAMRRVLGWAAAAHAEVKRVAAGRGVDLVSAPVTDGEGLFCHLDDDLKTVASRHTTTEATAGVNASWRLDPAVHDRIAAERVAARHARRVTGPGRGVPDRAAGHRREPDGKLRVLTVGRLDRRKGTDLFLAAAAVLGPEFPDAEFVLVGDDTGVPYRAAFERRYEGRPWATRVVFRGYVSEDELDAAFAGCDVVCLPARAAAGGRAAVEAMAFGKPVVAAGVGGLPEVVEDGVSGYLAYPGSDRSLADHLRLLLASPDLRARFGAAGRVRYEQMFRRDEMVRAAARAFTGIAESFAA